MIRRLLARFLSRKATSYQRCLAIHIHFAAPKGAMR
jgi:hypothetical protein